MTIYIGIKTANSTWEELLLFAIQGHVSELEKEKGTIAGLLQFIQETPYTKSKSEERIKGKFLPFMQEAIDKGLAELFPTGKIMLQKALKGDSELISFGNWGNDPSALEIEEIRENDMKKYRAYIRKLGQFMENESQAIPPKYPNFSCMTQEINVDDFFSAYSRKRTAEDFINRMAQIIKTSGPKREFDLVAKVGAAFRKGIPDYVEDIVVNNNLLFPTISDSISSEAMKELEIGILPSVLSTFLLQKMPVVKQREDEETF